MSARVEVISIGDELLTGNVLDTNSTWIGRTISEYGFEVEKFTTIPDEKAIILKTIANSFSESDIVLVTGGLGSTSDDITRKCLCEFFCTELVYNESVYSNILRIFKDNNINEDPELYKNQALVPQVCTPLLNKKGIAPILWFERMNKVLVAFPGVPEEMKAAMESDVLPRLNSFFEKDSIIQKTILLRGVGENTIAEKIKSIEEGLPSYVRISYLPQSTFVKVRLTGEHHDPIFLDKFLDDEMNKIKGVLEDNILSTEDIAPEKILTNILKEKNLTISTAESCTGGTIASYLAKHPGSSSFYIGSVVAYCNEVKHNVLGVSQETLDSVGAVSQQTVEQMVKGVCRLLKTDVGIAVSGVAGPDGGTKEKPVGTVWIAVGTEKEVVAKKLQLGTSREKNIEKASFEAIFLAKEFVQNKKWL